jgi:L-glyceraldehyde 3-phosphate reductase
MPIAADDPRLLSPYIAKATRYDDVPFARAGASGVRLPRVSLGLWQNFGRGRSIEAQREILLHAVDRGVVHIDLANNYGPPYGAAETTFGTVLESDLRRYRDELFLTTKAGYDMWPGPYGDGGSRKYLMRSLEQSLTRMRTDYVDVFYSHRVDPDTPLEETMQALVDIVRSGKALYVGISNYPAELTRRAHALLAAEGVRLLVHQPRYSLFDRTPEAELFPALRELRVGSAVFSPLAQGLLTAKYLDGTVPADSRAADSHFLNSSALRSMTPSPRARRSCRPRSSPPSTSSPRPSAARSTDAGSPAGTWPAAGWTRRQECRETIRRSWLSTGGS